LFFQEMRIKFKNSIAQEEKTGDYSLQLTPEQLEEQRSAAVKANAEEINDNIDKIQEATAMAAFFLPSYELRQAKITVEQLYELCETQVLKLLPKKRFHFKSRARRAEAKKIRDTEGTSSSSNLPSPPPPTVIATSSVSRLRKQLDLLSSLQVVFLVVVRMVICFTLSPLDYRRIHIQGVENSESIKDKKGEHIYRAFGTVEGKDIWLRQLENCTVTVCDRLGALRIDSVKNCTFIIGPVGGSIHLGNSLSFS